MLNTPGAVIVALVVTAALVAGAFLYRSAQAPSATSGAPAAPAPEASASQEPVLWCDGEEDECGVDEIIAEVSPEAGYIGGRTDVNANESGQNNRVLYYADPEMEPCQYTRLASTNGYLTVIIAGEGSFGREGAPDCLPES